jgi:hypothetical protein
VAFASGWEFNSSLFTLVENGLGKAVPSLVTTPWTFQMLLTRRAPAEAALATQEHPLDAFFFAKVVAFLAVLAVLAVLWWSRRDDTHSYFAHTFLALAATVLLSPVTDPWYYGWLMPFAVVFVAPSWLWLSGGMFVYYLYFWRDPWDYLPWSRPLEYGPFYALLAVERRAEALSGARTVAGALARALRAAVGPASSAPPLPPSKSA